MLDYKSFGARVRNHITYSDFDLIESVGSISISIFGFNVSIYMLDFILLLILRIFILYEINLIFSNFEHMLLYVCLLEYLRLV